MKTNDPDELVRKLFQITFAGFIAFTLVVVIYIGYF